MSPANSMEVRVSEDIFPKYRTKEDGGLWERQWVTVRITRHEVSSFSQMVGMSGSDQYTWLKPTRGEAYLVDLPIDVFTERFEALR